MDHSEKKKSLWNKKWVHVFRQASYLSNVFKGLSLNNKNTVLKAELF